MLWVPCQRPKTTHGSIDEQGWIDWLPIEVSKEELRAEVRHWDWGLRWKREAKRGNVGDAGGATVSVRRSTQGCWNPESGDTCFNTGEPRGKERAQSEPQGATHLHCQFSQKLCFCILLLKDTSKKKSLDTVELDILAPKIPFYLLNIAPHRVICSNSLGESVQTALGYLRSCF